MSNETFLKQVVRWQDGSYDVNRTCVECHDPNCMYPVLSNLGALGDGYGEISKKGLL